MNEEIDIIELEAKANARLDEILEERDDNDENKRRIERLLKKMEEVKEDERCTKSFFDKFKLHRKEEKIESLLEGKKEQEVEITDIDGLKRITSNFYKDLWKKRKIDKEARARLIAKIIKKISEENKKKCNNRITIEEFKEIKKKIRKNKSPGIDGIPGEFYQVFEFLDEWMVQLFNESIDRKEMTETMRTSVVKLLFKKGDKRNIGNYRPISLLCSDYKLLAKIITERMKTTLNEIIGVEQQGFVQSGDIQGNLLLVKEIIDYCNETGEEGALILMDFAKAFDRVDRETLMLTLKKMNFGEEFCGMIEMLYNNVQAKVVVNGDLAESFQMMGGVKQGCPLSPYLFICVLELMAIAIRENEELTGIKEPNTGESDKISLFADDSAMMLADVAGQIKEGRRTIKEYEEATGAMLHDTKTMIMKIGGTRNTNLNWLWVLGIDFEVLSDEAIERYLGDMVGNQIDEEQRFGASWKSMENTGKAWGSTGIGIFGRKLVANTLLLSKVKFRGGVNALSSEMKKKTTDIIKNFVWEGKRPKVRWEVIVRKEEQGGVRLREPSCDLDAAKLKIIKNMLRRPEQPWVKWIERKLQKAKEKIATKSCQKKDHVLELEPSKKERNTLKKNCIAESTLHIWYELGGTSRRKYELKTGKKVKKVKRKKGEKNQEIGWGFEIEGKWHDLGTIKTSQIYETLLEKRIKKLKPGQVKTNWGITTLQKWLTPKERDFWWRTAHKLVMVNARKSKWKKVKGKRTSDRCPVCKTEKEYWKHYAYDCRGLNLFMEKLGDAATKWYEDLGTKEHWTKPSREEWDLEAEKMTRNKMIVIAKARWIYHCQRCLIDLKKKKTLDINLLLARVTRALDKITEMLK